MNYITEIKAFYDLVAIKQLSTGQIALWFALMHINNKCAWQEWFTVPNITLELHSGLSRQGIVKNRNALKQLGLIDFKTGGTKATNYKLNIISKSVQAGLQESLQESVQVGLQGSLQGSVQDSSALNKLNETKRNIKKDISKESRFKPPSEDEVKDYCTEKGYEVDAEYFVSFYESKGWLVGKSKMKDWRAAVRNWHMRNRKEGADNEKRAEPPKYGVTL